MHFNELNLSQELLRAVDELGYTEMTEIQQESIPLLLEGRDVVGRSNTGTGKTAAFGIPAVESITEADRKSAVVLILCPTRELAMQANEEIRKFAKYKEGVKSSAVYGGASMEKQIHELKRGANIIIGTPGRVMDHIRRRTLKLDNIRTVILDEADEMLNMGFRDDIETILADMPENRQTVLFSATMPKEIMAITEKYQTDPVHIKIKSAQKTVELIEQFYFEVAMGRKTDALRLLLAAYKPSSAMVFCNTKAMVDQLTEELVKHGFRAAGLHGDMKQIQRTQVMNSFKNKSTEILVATDVAARGIDVSGVDAVFNYDLPQDNEYYIHRIGRTGRAGRTGTAYTLISGRRQLFDLRAIEKYTHAEIREMPLPDKSDIIAMKKEAVVKEITEAAAGHDAYDILDRLASTGIDYREAAARVIAQMLRAETESLPDFEKAKPLRKGRNSGAKTVKIVINIGRNRRIAPNFILGALVDATGMTGKDFGKIDIFNDHTTVEVPEAESEYIIESTDSIKINGNKVEVKLYKGGENLARRSSRRPDDKPHFDRKKAAYGGKKKSEIYTDYIPNRKKRMKKRH
ncbi:ATP-dependent RNA helicase DeaD [Ruminococcus flavefaciens]|uniref:ATP-dependent RNA helicase CshA n=1 Tax=Ruminococcus flavefaciens TaxID=1265 RepID=A0A1H6HSZ5_RUMFL|nr:DEAD/DEAH box helicase [Ruminococcus flavefaciens]SEH39046.1 ATP-dependent RNA helicase DeaD [Ruminococcus flavefaciens]